MTDRSLTIISTILQYIAGAASAMCLVLLVAYVGFEITPDDARHMLAIFRGIQLVFIVNILYNLIFRFRATVRGNRIIKWIVDIAVLLTMLVWLYPDPATPWIPWLERVLYSRKFLFIVLGTYSAVDICYAISRIPGRRTNPSLMLALTFLVFIILGALALMLPKSTTGGISFFDSLFLASSAVCITGLSPVDIPATLTPLGLAILSVLVQLGSLGIITFTSFFAIFFTGTTSIYNQLLLKDVIYSKSMNALVPTLLYVLGFTISIEVIGAVCVFFTIPGTLALSIEEKLVFSAFHSMSAFCNAGFSCLPGGMSNPALLTSNQWIYIVTSVLIFAGAVGFPILVNFKEIIKCYIRRAWLRLRHTRSSVLPLHIFDLNTKVVLYTTVSILVVCSAAFFVLEYDNSLAGMSVGDKVVQSVFNSLIPRSAGFASVNPAAFLDVTLLIVLVQMFIGGSSQSMAGGIKVNTVGAVMLNLRSILSSREGVSAFHRTISLASIRRANAMVAISLLALFAYTVAVLCLEPTLPAKSVVFEVMSALFTVGSSLGITADLSNSSKVILSTAMFFGRVGILSFLMGLVPQRPDVSTHYPTDNIIIN